jgi:hydroxyacylglutathione hydrolase
MNVATIPALGDNLIYLVSEGASCAVVDPGEARPVLDALSRLGGRLQLILITHTHADHTGGCAELKHATGCRIVGPAGTPGMDEEAVEAGVVTCAGVRFDILGIPGHTDSHVAYHSAQAGIVFTGDALFAGGCGRVFGGDFGRMRESLMRLRALPDATRVYGGHDYVIENLTFAAGLEPGNADVRVRLECERRRCAAGRPLAASTLEEEKRTNPFLRCDDLSFVQAVGMQGADPTAVFAAIRRRKDRFGL